MIQGCRQSVLCSYVFDELPLIYKLVCDNIPKHLPVKATNNRSSATVKCDQCSFKSTLILMKKHIQKIHTRPPRAVKRMPTFTPIVKPSKKIKSNLDIDFNINNEASNNEIEEIN